MASGRPDYTRTIDILYQSLAQVTNRPKYGGAQLEVGYATVDANGETELINITGKGVIYGGFFRLAHTSTQLNSAPRLYVDGVRVATLDFCDLARYGLVVDSGYSTYLLVLDDVNYIYSAGISRDITFETSLKTTYNEWYGSTPFVWSILYYALV